MARRTDKALVADEAWESGKLGREEKYIRRADKNANEALDDALGMQMISIRLHKALIEDLKFIAKHNGIGYQPLIRQLLSRFATSETKRIAKELYEEMEARERQAEKEAGKRKKIA